MSGLLDKALLPTAAIAGAIACAVAYGLLDVYGPSGRVQFFEYLPLLGLMNYLIALFLGVWLGAKAYRRFMPKEGERGARAGRLGRLMAAAAVLAVAWLVNPQFRAFPKSGTVAEREAWTLRNVREYDALTRTVEKIPEVTGDVGRITGIAPTATDRHIAAQEMNGVGMNFKLDVVGEKGGGVLRVFCTLDSTTVYEWRPATWTFGGRTTEIATVPNMFKPNL